MFLIGGQNFLNESNKTKNNNNKKQYAKPKQI